MTADPSSTVSADGWLALAAALVLGIPTLIWTVRGARKEPYRLEYYFWHWSNLLNLPQRSVIEVKVNGRPVRTAWQLTIRFVNSGTQPIRPEEWQQPIRLVYPEGSNPISSVLSAIKPNSLVVQTRVDGQEVVIDPVLLNQGDLFELQIVGDGAFVLPEARSRIANLPSMKRRKFIYNLGNGPEGRPELGNRIFHWIFAACGPLFSALILLATASGFALSTRFILVAAILVGVDVLVPLWARSAEKRRDVWRPTALVTDAKPPEVPAGAVEAEADVEAEAGATAELTLDAEAEVTPAPPKLKPEGDEVSAILKRVLEDVAGWSDATRKWRIVRVEPGSTFWTLANVNAGEARNVVLLALNTRFTFLDVAAWDGISQGQDPCIFRGKPTKAGYEQGITFEIQWDELDGDRFQETFVWKAG